MAKKNNDENKTALYATLGVIIAAFIAGIFGLFQGGCNRQEQSVKPEQNNESHQTSIHVHDGDDVGRDKIQNFFLIDTTKQESSHKLEKQTGMVRTPQSSSTKGDFEEELEISIQLPDRVNGYEKVFVNGKKALISSSSTRLNPRILIKSNVSETQYITIVTKTMDTCTLERRFDANEKDSFPIAFSPDCF